MYYLSSLAALTDKSLKVASGLLSTDYTVKPTLNFDTHLHLYFHLLILLLTKQMFCSTVKFWLWGFSLLCAYVYCKDLATCLVSFFIIPFDKMSKFYGKPYNCRWMWSWHLYFSWSQKPWFHILYAKSIHFSFRYSYMIHVYENFQTVESWMW